MRGKDILGDSEAVAERITPAHAGKSLKFLGKTETKRDHPRTCGEKQLYESGKREPPGSPPHMRGKGMV